MAYHIDIDTFPRSRMSRDELPTFTPNSPFTASHACVSTLQIEKARFGSVLEPQATYQPTY